MKYAVNLAVDYTRVEKAAFTDKMGTLEAMYAAIGCEMIEIVRVDGLPEGYVLVVDEEGRCKEHPTLNPLASYLYHTDRHNSPIVGNAVIMKEVMTPEGAELAFLTEDEAKEMESFMLKLWRKAVQTMLAWYNGLERPVGK